MGVSFTDKELIETGWWDLVRKLSEARNGLIGETSGQRQYFHRRTNPKRMKKQREQTEKWRAAQPKKRKPKKPMSEKAKQHRLKMGFKRNPGKFAKATISSEQAERMRKWKEEHTVRQ